MLEKRYDYRLDTCKNWKRVGSEDLCFESSNIPRNKFQLMTLNLGFCLY